MALASTDIDARLEQMAQSVRAVRAAAQEVKASTNRAVSELSQFTQTHAAVIEAISELAGSTNPVAQLQIAKLHIIADEASAVYAALSAVKAAIDQLGL
jgi:stage III sporulation protein SpoIIIAA